MRYIDSREEFGRQQARQDACTRHHSWSLRHYREPVRAATHVAMDAGNKLRDKPEENDTRHELDGPADRNQDLMKISYLRFHGGDIA
ncbi:hypothetical protein DFLDMN_001479 [Cupriavidus sp. H19C3]|uniref:hypothetical protein n=1 Tax=Cupriavidus sp. H19C3 TaxID=3241603 RepID=UPI003BF77915